jgi:asparagine synthase (glutamine-hydrolysing)
MSVQAGIWNFDGKPVDRTLLGQLSEALKQQGPDGEFCHMDGSIALLYRPFHTTAESRREKQPYVSRRGFVVTWDGRLDNREELAIELHDEVTADATDVDLFGGAFDRWESECFRRIIGDWAVSIWKPKERELILACDFMAIRHIFYYLRDNSVWWATDLTPLVLLSGGKFRIDDEYMAGYFANDPDAHLTPYREIRQVPPGQFVRVRIGSVLVNGHWRFDAKSPIRYETDAEYEEHFRCVFQESVRRRLRSDSPVLSELSGGLDSSSIVCIADDILAKEQPLAPRLDTLSYHDTTEPRGDDWIYFQEVEAYRGRVGHRIDVGSILHSSGLPASCTFRAMPSAVGWEHALEVERAAVLRFGGYRVVLSGIGGDEFLGGIPDPSSLLADLIVQLKPIKLVHELVTWSIANRRPLLHLLWRAALELVPTWNAPNSRWLAHSRPWINQKFAREMSMQTNLGPMRQPFIFSLPTRRSCIGTIILMANKLAKSIPPEREETRYPYLDQDLIEFVLSVPTSQLLRPGERRSLMRRAFLGLVPSSVLSRKTKQFAARTPVLVMEKNFNEILRLFTSPICDRFGFIDAPAFLEYLRASRNGRDVAIVQLLKTIYLEVWLRGIVSRALIVNSDRGNEALGFSEACA